MTGTDSGIRVVVADDDGDLRGLLAHYLGEPPFDLVGAVATTDEALALAAERQLDAVLVDVNMPGGGALRVAETLNETSPATAVVVLSGLDEDNLVRGILQAGAMAYLVKGASREEIVNTVRRAVDARRQLAR